MEAFVVMVSINETLTKRLQDAPLIATNGEKRGLKC